MTLGGRDFIRYSRHLLLDNMGEEGQETLLRSRVLIVGLGGLGSPVAFYMAAAGVGDITLCDPDVVELSNLQRQILYTEEDCGHPKVEIARERLLALNGGLQITDYRQAVDDNIWRDSPGYNLVLDCTDNLRARHWLNRKCRSVQTPLVSAAAIAWEGQIVTFDFSSPSPGCLACAIPEDSPEPVATCSNTGVIGPVLGAMGSLQAIAGIKLLTGQGGRHGHMQRYDAQCDQWQSYVIRANPRCLVCS